MVCCALNRKFRSMYSPKVPESREGPELRFYKGNQLEL
jgi:hypothetical protein